MIAWLLKSRIVKRQNDQKSFISSKPLTQRKTCKNEKIERLSINNTISRWRVPQRRTSGHYFGDGKGKMIRIGCFIIEPENEFNGFYRQMNRERR
jgi:hypothetical protein